MKRSVFALLILAGMAVAPQAQAQEKKWWVGGTVGYSSTKLPGVHDANESLTVLPEFGYNLSGSWALGIQFGMNQAGLNTGTSYADFQEFSVAPFARYTFLKWKAFSLFADGGIGYSDLTGDTDLGDNANINMHVSQIGLFVNPGVSLRLTERFALIGRMNLFTVGYMQSAPDKTSNDKTKTFTAGLNSPFNPDDIELGVVFRF